jgi:hypothetical protein
LKRQVRNERGHSRQRGNENKTEGVAHLHQLVKKGYEDGEDRTKRHEERSAAERMCRPVADDTALSLASATASEEANQALREQDVC